MKRKSDFVTNSSSTSYIVIETWELVSGDIKIYKDKTRIESRNITKQFIDFVNGMTEPKYQFMIDFSTVMNEDHLQLGFGGDETDFSNWNEIELGTGKNNEKMYIYSPDFTLNVYDDKSMNCSFHYTTNESAKSLNKAIDLMVVEFIKILGITNKIDVEIERRIFEFGGDGWDGGDPMGYYAESDVCREEVECKRILTLNEGE